MDINEILDIVDIYDDDYQPNRLFWKRRRLNPLVYIESDALFKLTHRFDKRNARKIASELSPFLNLATSRRGDP